MSIQGHTEVLVVGAGPTGLALGATLARQGVRTLVIDKCEGRSVHSKALGVQAGTLEALGQAFGDDLPQRMVTAGHAARSVFFHFGKQRPVRVRLSQIPSPYNFVLILAQGETERFLEEEMNACGATVERCAELVSIRDTPECVVAVVRDARGEDHEITADYAVGCDGAHSVVRRDTGIAFAGGSYRGDFVLGDVTLDWPWRYDAVRMFVSDRGFLGCFPMRGEKGSYRLIMASEVDSSALTPDISGEEFGEMVSDRAPRRVTIMHDTWLTRFNLHHRMAERFRLGRIFLAGDAAHIHSPVGGQGMNTGIHDALNLGHRLACVLRRGHDVGTLAGYERDRMPIARSVLRRTDRAFRAVLALNTSRWRRVRLWLAPRVVAMPWFQRRLLRMMSQVDVARKEMAERASG